MPIRAARHFDSASLAVIAATLVLFVAALFVKGLTHDLLLEAGVFLVSAKLVLAQYKAATVAEETRVKLDEILVALRRPAEAGDRSTAPSVQRTAEG